MNARPADSALASTRGPRGGFALLFVVTLLAFIVLLLVGLASYTRIETAAAGNTQRQAQARENALLALNLAVAQLQRHAGPDTRVTATAESSATGSTARYTGVWPADPADDDDNDPLTPLAWLASGNELRNSAGVLQPRAVVPGAAMNATNAVALVGTNSSRVNNDVMARLVPITVPGVPGSLPTPGNNPGSSGPAVSQTTVGRYAWWVGDQGVKAPVAVPDTSTAPTYAPYDSADLRARLRQQVTAGAGAATTAGAAVFEPRDNNNASLVSGEKILQQSQVAFLKNSGGSQLGLTTAQQYFHTWSPNNLAVLADTRRGGLKRDLSVAPTLLGDAFAAWMNYKAYTEDPSAPAPESGVPPSISPAYSTDPVRRRVVMTPHLISDGGAHQVAPVVNYFLITFNVRTVGGSKGNQPLEVRARWMVSLWNPYTSALVPEDLRVEVTGLPSNLRVNNVSENPERARPLGSFSLGSAYGTPLRINLPWTANASADPDRQSWLPGRVYSWISKEDTSKPEEVPAEGFESVFYSQTLNNAGKGVIRPLGLAEVDGDDPCQLEIEGEENLGITLFVLRRDADGNIQPVQLSRLTSPLFVQNFFTTPQAASGDGYQFSYVFRLAESKDTPEAPGTWLTTTGRDVRRRSIPSECFVVPPDGNDPSVYVNYTTIRDEERLIDREHGSNRSYEKDTPVFELPRAPVLSLGMLQHFRQPGLRPFMIGNPSGASVEVAGIRGAELFDRFFFSGLVEGVTPAKNAVGDLILPNPLQRALRKASADDLRAVPEARSSRYLLQAGAFNVNSVNAAAWAAVLRGVRFPSPQTFSYLNLAESTGTASDTQKLTVQSSDAQFFRFSQSAQETYQLPGTDNYPLAANHLFRRGMRTLTSAQVGALAAKIVELVRRKHVESGPFRSMEEFLSPATLFAGGTQGFDRSLLEAAIDEAGVNGEFAEFGISPTEFPAVQMNSQWLTQADILTALAPVLTPRSDTFLVRTYGEAINPATNATEGRAWCEAVVQRVPEYLDAADAPEVLPADLTSEVNRAGGRRFKVISFRWLTRADI